MACLFFSGFETGDTSEFTSVVGTTSVQTTTVLTGGYSGKLNTTAASVSQIKKSGFSLTTAYARARMRLDLTLNPGSTQFNRGLLAFMAADNTTIGKVGVQITTAGVITMSCFCQVGNVESSGFAINANQTYLIELKTVVSATVGIVEFKIDGVIMATLSGQNSGTANITQCWFQAALGAGTLDMYVDDLYVDDAAYPGAGKCLTRQGLAGSPTYNAWTKTGLTTAADCWSETPFSATNNCNLAGTAAGAQTMLVAPFNATQTGHGTEIIGTRDTINACKVSTIAKVSSTSSPPTFNIRRRLNSSDTDTAKTLTTADVYYESGIFTDTVTNLNAAEIGAARGTSAATKTDTVEEEWLMVDFTVVSPLGGLAMLGVGR